MLNLECIIYVGIDTEYIADKCFENSAHPTEDIVKENVEWYIQGLDDCEYYAIGNEEEELIIEEVIKIIKEREKN